MAADQFSYPVKFLEGTTVLKKYCRRIIRLTGFDTIRIYLYRNQHWARSYAGLKFPRTSLENVIYRAVVQDGHFVEFSDLLSHPSYKFIVLKSGLPFVGYIAAVPIFTPCKIVTGSITMLDRRRNALQPGQIELLEHYSYKIASDARLSSIP